MDCFLGMDENNQEDLHIEEFVWEWRVLQWWRICLTLYSTRGICWWVVCYKFDFKMSSEPESVIHILSHNLRLLSCFWVSTSRFGIVRGTAVTVREFVVILKPHFLFWELLCRFQNSCWLRHWVSHFWFMVILENHFRETFNSWLRCISAFWALILGLWYIPLY